MKNAILFIVLTILGSSCVELSRKETFTIYGCTDPDALNHSREATENDGTCEYQSGCTDPEAANYNAAARDDDGSCYYEKKVVFYSSGIWAGTNETPVQIEVYSAYNGSTIGRIYSFTSDNPSACTTKQSDNTYVVGVVGDQSSYSFYANYIFSKYDPVSQSYTQDSRRVDFSIDIPNNKSYCDFYLL